MLEDILLESIFITLCLVDWGQTLNIADNPHLYYERNPLLGQHPSRGKVNTYFAIAIPLHIGVTYALPKKWRSFWLKGSIGVEVLCVGNNFVLGINTAF